MFRVYVSCSLRGFIPSSDLNKPGSLASIYEQPSRSGQYFVATRNAGLAATDKKMPATDPFHPAIVWLSDVIPNRKVAYLLNKKGVIMVKMAQ